MTDWIRGAWLPKDDDWIAPKEQVEYVEEALASYLDGAIAAGHPPYRRCAGLARCAIEATYRWEEKQYATARKEFYGEA